LRTEVSTNLKREALRCVSANGRSPTISIAVTASLQSTILRHCARPAAASPSGATKAVTSRSVPWKIRPSARSLPCTATTPGMSCAALMLMPGDSNDSAVTDFCAASAPSASRSTSTRDFWYFSIGGMPGVISCSRLKKSPLSSGCQPTTPKSARETGPSTVRPDSASTTYSDASSEPAADRP
jgi:hypothetical protein